MDWKEISIVLLFVVSNVICNSHGDFECKARPVVVSVRDVHDINDDFLPKAVLLYQCSGETQDMSHRCLPQDPKTIKVRLERAGTTLTDTKELQNHTNCASRCVCEKEGRSCMPNAYDAPCPKGLKWSRKDCTCVPKACSNPGKSTNGIGKGEISVTMFIVALLIEFVAVLIIIFLVMDACKYRKHSKGVIFKTAQYVRQISNGEREGFKISTLKRERDTTGSVSFLYEINASNAHGKAAV